MVEVPREHKTKEEDLQPKNEQLGTALATQVTIINSKLHSKGKDQWHVAASKLQPSQNALSSRALKNIFLHSLICHRPETKRICSTRAQSTSQSELKMPLKHFKENKTMVSKRLIFVWIQSTIFPKESFIFSTELMSGPKRSWCRQSWTLQIISCKELIILNCINARLRQADSAGICQDSESQIGDRAKPLRGPLVWNWERKKKNQGS